VDYRCGGAYLRGGLIPLPVSVLVLVAVVGALAILGLLAVLAMVAILGLLAVLAMVAVLALLAVRVNALSVYHPYSHPYSLGISFLHPFPSPQCFTPTKDRLNGSEWSNTNPSSNSHALMLYPQLNLQRSPANPLMTSCAARAPLVQASALHGAGGLPFGRTPSETFTYSKGKFCPIC